MGETQRAFSEIIDRYGGSHDRDFENRVNAVPIDGEPLGVKPAEKRRPRSIFYEQTYLEALSVARALVQLELDGDVANIVRREPPKPDIEVQFKSQPPIYIEHTMVQPYDGLSFARHREDLNLELEDRRDADVEFRNAWEIGILIVKMSDPGFGKRPPLQQTVEQIAHLASGFSEDVSLLRPDRSMYPELAAYQPTVFYRLSTGARSRTICQAAALAFDPSAVWSVPRMQAALAGKQQKAMKYEPAARPLWLLITIDDEETLPGAIPHRAVDAFADTEIAPFSRLLIANPGDPLAVLEPSGA